MQEHTKKIGIQSYFSKNKGWFVLLILAYLLEAGGLVMISFFISQVFQAIGSNEMKDIYNLFPLGFFTLLIYITGQNSQYFCRRKFLMKVDTQLRNDIFSIILSKDFTDFCEKNTAEYISIMNNDLVKIEEGYFTKIPYMIETIILSVIASCSLFFYSKEMAFVIILSAILTIVIPILFGKYMESRTTNYMQGVSKYNVRIKDIFGGFEVIKSFKAEKPIELLHMKSLKDMEQKKYNYRSANNTVVVITELVIYLIIILQYSVGAYFVTKGQVTLAAVMGTLNLANTVNNQFREATYSISSIRGSKGIQNSIQNLLTQNTVPKKIHSDQNKIGDIRVENLSFSYEQNSSALESIDFTFERGKKYAIVGGSGSGKSTFVKLLMQYYNNYYGKIYFDNQDIQSISKEDLYSRMSIIHQNVFLFDDTLKNNITMYQDYDSQLLQDVIRKSGLESVVNQHTENLEYQVGEGGNRLSGGEQQRIAIARALLKKASILILDEATSSLDSIVSAQIENTVLSQTDTTAIVVTHKLSEVLLKKYDCIVVMHRGKISEYGKFEDLMEKKDKFYSLFMLR